MSPSIGATGAIGIAGTPSLTPISYTMEAPNGLFTFNDPGGRASAQLYAVSGYIHVPMQPALDLTGCVRIAVREELSRIAVGNYQNFRNSYVEVRARLCYVLNRIDESGDTKTEFRMGIDAGVQSYNLAYDLRSWRHLYDQDFALGTFSAQETASGLQPVACCTVQGVLILVKDLWLTCTLDATYTSVASRHINIVAREYQPYESLNAQYRTGVPFLISFGLGIEYAL